MPANSLRRMSLFGINLNLESVMCRLKIMNKWMIKQIIKLSMSWNNSKIIFEVIKNHIGKEMRPWEFKKAFFLPCFKTISHINIIMMIHW